MVLESLLRLQVFDNRPNSLSNKPNIQSLDPVSKLITRFVTITLVWFRNLSSYFASYRIILTFLTFSHMIERKQEITIPLYVNRLTADDKLTRLMD